MRFSVNNSPKGRNDPSASLTDMAGQELNRDYR
jgi:hypothetical protein